MDMFRRLTFLSNQADEGVEFDGGMVSDVVYENRQSTGKAAPADRAGGSRRRASPGCRPGQRIPSPGTTGRPSLRGSLRGMPWIPGNPRGCRSVARSGPQAAEKKADVKYFPSQMENMCRILRRRWKILQFEWARKRMAMTRRRNSDLSDACAGSNKEKVQPHPGRVRLRPGHLHGALQGHVRNILFTRPRRSAALPVGSAPGRVSARPCA